MKSGEEGVREGGHVSLAVTPLFSAVFLTVSFAYRSGRGTALVLLCHGSHRLPHRAAVMAPEWRVCLGVQIFLFSFFHLYRDFFIVIRRSICSATVRGIVLIDESPPPGCDGCTYGLP